MKTQQTINYERIAEAIRFYQERFKEQPSLDTVAAHIHVSPFHFQRMFREWAGITPKQFLQFISLEHAKDLLKSPGTNLSDAAFETGLSGTGRLHDLFIKVEGMTPGEYKNGGEHLHINYSFADTPFGTIIVAATSKGICHMAFTDRGEEEALNELVKRYPAARVRQLLDDIQQNALYIFTRDWSQLNQIKLHVKGSPFQLKVWETLLKIPAGRLGTYSGIATAMRNPLASRAIGTAIANNPVAFLIPCHRVIRATGDFGQYHWGSTRKTAMIGWEAGRSQ